MTAATFDQSGLLGGGLFNRYGVDAADVIYDKTCVGYNASTGYARPLVAGDKFLGLNISGKVDNSLGAADAKDVQCEAVACLKEAIVGLVGVFDEGKEVFATDDNTYTIIPPAVGSGSLVGIVKQFISAAVGVIEFRADISNDLSVGIIGSAPTGAQVATAGAATYTAAQLLSGVILRDPAGANRTDVSPTAVLVLAAMPAAVVGSKFEFVIQNDADAAETITLSAGTGFTLAGTMTIAQNYSKRFLVEFTNVTSGAVAATIRNLGTYLS